MLPLPVSGTFTYSVPENMVNKIKPGIRVVVQFGRRKVYTALVLQLHSESPKDYEVKNILSVLDEIPVVNPIQIRFWQWIASYYLCYPGEVMNAALPAAFKLASESKIVLNATSEADLSLLNEKEQLLVEALHNRKAIEISEVSRILDQQKIIPVIKNLMDKGYILMEEEIADRYRPKKEVYIRLTAEYSDNDEKLRELFDVLEKKARKQLELLMSFYLLSQMGQVATKEVKRSDLLKSINASPFILEALIKKNVFESHEKIISRLEPDNAVSHADSIQLSPLQSEAFTQIKQIFQEKDVVLLHGVTSSGKTELYIKFIQETISQGKQVLYILPEIALTTQIIIRLKRYFGDRVGVYHSRFNENERVEIWNSILSGRKNDPGTRPYDIILGARSAVFLPYSDLGLVIVDEEHDSSFKQFDPAPRYHARDAALYLAHLHGAKTILGSATPSLESYFNAREGKYALVEMNERYGNMELPEILVVDIRNEIRWKKMKSHFSSVLMKQLEEALANQEQSILFQNRRGFSLRLECETCNWMPLCRNCDVTLVYHKQNNHLRCHYCGYVTRIPEKCPECKGTLLKMRGFGTEKVEEELGILFPDARIRRMDLDTTRSKLSHHKILQDFEERKINILVGTQMVTKGLDFDNVSTVSILNADNMLNFPDFRAAERSYQLMAQVSGRAGRKYKKGKVIIQTYNPDHPIIRCVVNNAYTAFYQQQLLDRRKFRYPPFYRLIHLKVKHRDQQVLSTAAENLATGLKKIFGARILGPEFPIVSRIQNYYIKQILIKFEREESLSRLKAKLVKEVENFLSRKDFSAVKLVIDVDPQ